MIKAYTSTKVTKGLLLQAETTQKKAYGGTDWQMSAAAGLSQLTYLTKMQPCTAHLLALPTGTLSLTPLASQI